MDSEEDLKVAASVAVEADPVPVQKYPLSGTKTTITEMVPTITSMKLVTASMLMKLEMPEEMARKHKVKNKKL